MPVLIDAFRVFKTIAEALLQYCAGLGFETQRIVILRETPWVVQVVPPVEAALIRAKQVFEPRRSPWRFTLPGWSRLTRHPYEREHTVEFRWF